MEGKCIQDTNSVEETDESFDEEQKNEEQKKDGEKNKQATYKSVRKAAPKSGKKAAIKGVGSAAHLMLVRNDIGVVASTSTHEKSTVEAHVTEVAKLKVLSADANAAHLHASASASASPVGAEASAAASVAEAGAGAALVEGVLEASADASFSKASAHAGAGLQQLGALAGAEANVAKASVGISNTPLQAHAVLVGAGAEAGVSWKYAGLSAGAYLLEARAGPFAARAGLKFGAGIRNGVPEVDLGPVTTPCSIM